MPLGADAGRPPVELLAFDVRQWIDLDEPVPPTAWSTFDHALDPVHAWRVARGRERHQAACAAWEAATGLLVHRPAAGESWEVYRARVGPPPAGTASAIRARLRA